VCAACHGADGNSSVPLQPTLAQQHPEYLVKQLLEFKSGVRKDPIMVGFAGMLSEQDARNIAAWLATQKEKPGFAKEKDLVMLGEKIYRGGMQDRHIPACAGCHSPNGGHSVAVPAPVGPARRYTAKQLAAFRDGSRGNSMPDARHLALPDGPGDQGGVGLHRRPALSAEHRRWRRRGNRARHRLARFVLRSHCQEAAGMNELAAAGTSAAAGGSRLWPWRWHTAALRTHDGIGRHPRLHPRRGSPACARRSSCCPRCALPSRC
jgi:cytochrome c553